MNRTIERIINTIEAYQMIRPDEHVIAGISGGADSVCLLAALLEWQKRHSCSITAVHVEHGIRGAASLQDAAWVEALCRNWNVPCIVRQIDAGRLAEERHQTLEEAARQARYEIFETIRTELRADKTAVAHHENDQAETVLMNLMRGSGLRGLGGILPVRDRIIRPMLFVSRKEIEAVLAERKQTFCTDLTNLEPDYTRNKLRLLILPQMEAINARAVAHIAGSARQLQKAEAYLLRQTQLLYQDCVSTGEDGMKVKLENFLLADELLQEYVLRSMIERLLEGRGLKDYTETHMEQLKKLASMPCGKQMDFPGGMQAVRRQEGELLLRKSWKKEKIRAGDTDAKRQMECQIRKSGIFEINGSRFRVEITSEKTDTFPEKKYTKWLSYDTISNNVCIRTRRRGDYLVVNQEGGRKKLKDYLIDQKIPREQRDQVLLVAEGSHVLWVVGLRISEDAKVTEKTTDILKIQMMEDYII